MGSKFIREKVGEYLDNYDEFMWDPDIHDTFSNNLF